MAPTGEGGRRVQRSAAQAVKTLSAKLGTWGLYFAGSGSSDGFGRIWRQTVMGRRRRGHEGPLSRE